MIQGDWCERLTDAITEGRFVEDAAFWKPHVESCAGCRHIVEGLFDLRDLVEKARLEAPAVERTPDETKRMLDEVVRRYAAERRSVRVVACLAVALVLGAVAFVGLRERDRSTDTAHTDPAAYAMSLYRRVFPVDGQVRRDALQDPDVRREYLRALHDPSPLVRRTVTALLVTTGVPIPPERLEAALGDWRGGLQTPLEVASAGDTTRLLEERLEAQRSETLSSVLTTIGEQVLRRQPSVSHGMLLPYLTDRDPRARWLAMRALGADASFVPGEETVAALRDSDADVRTSAARALIARLGPAGAESVLEYLTTHDDEVVEERVFAQLAGLPGSVERSEQRMKSATASLPLRLLHALHVLRAGRRDPPQALIDAGLESRDVVVRERVATLIAEGDWPRYRAVLQERWRAAPHGERLPVGSALVHWDVRSGDEARLALALEILEQDRDPALRDVATDLTKSPIASVRERARALTDDWPLK